MHLELVVDDRDSALPLMQAQLLVVGGWNPPTRAIVGGFRSLHSPYAHWLWLCELNAALLDARVMVPGRLRLAV